jgi:hypothetical protein
MTTSETTFQFGITDQSALILLQQLMANEHSDDRGDMVRVGPQHSIPTSDAMVNASHKIGTNGVITYNDYKEQLANIVIEGLEVTTLPSQDDPKVRLMAIMEMIDGDNLVLNEDLGLTVPIRQVFSTVTGHLVHKTKIDRDRFQRKRMYVHLPLDLHMEWLRGKIVEATNTKLQALPDNHARALWIMANYLVGDGDGLYHSIKFCDGFVRPLSKVPTMLDTGLITKDAKRTTMFQFLVTNLIKGLPTLPSTYKPEMRLQAMLDMEVDGQVNVDSILVPPERIGFTPGHLELTVMRPGMISWTDHYNFLVDMVSNLLPGDDDGLPKQHTVTPTQQPVPRPVRRGPRVDPTTPGLGRKERSAAYAAMHR